MASYDELARTYANQKRAEYENSLGYLTSDAAAANTAAVNSINTQYNNLVSAINTKRQDVADTYENEAQQTYINKLLAGRQLGTTLSQLGLNTQGMGVQQQLANETAYGQNLATLQANRDKGIRDIETQITQTEGQRASALAGQAGKYAEALAAANLQKQQLADQYYNQQYSNYLADLQYQDKLKQQQYENALAEKKYQDQLKQQAFENNMAKQQLALQQAAAKSSGSSSSSSSGGSGSKTSGTGATYVKLNNSDKTKNKSDYYFKSTTGRDYQPRYINNTKLKKTGQKLADIGTIKGVSGSKNIWTANGKYYVWDEDHYLELKI